MDKNIDDMLEELIKSSKKVCISDDVEEPFILKDLETGERLLPKPSVEYCYENSCISSDNIWKR